MKYEIKVPSMGESITEVTIGSILTPSGSAVKADEPLLEVETDKVNQLLYASQAGVVTLNVKAGDVVKVGQVIGAVDSDSKSSEANQPSTQIPAEKEVPKVKEELKFEPKKLSEEPKTEPQKNILTSAPAMQLLRETKEDFLAELKSNSGEKKSPASVEKKSENSISAPKERGETRRKMSTIRKVIGKRMVESQQTTAMLTTFNEVDMSQVIQLREKYKEVFQKKYGAKLGFMPFFIKAVVMALQSCPDLNSYIDGDDIIHRDYYDISIAIGTDRGVIVPVIRNCDRLSFAEIEIAIEEYAKKAKQSTLSLNDLQGGGFTITNGGVYGSLLSTPILNPPQSGILGMHKIEKRAVVVDDQIVIRSMMYLALSYDHRIVDGKEAVTFLVNVKNALEDLSRLIIDI